MAEGNGLRPQNINYKVAVGVDFGTYGSAIASMLLVAAGGGGRGPDVQHEVKFGTSAKIGALDKTPTSLLLNEEYEITEFGAAALDEYLQKDEDSKEEFYFCEKFKMALFEEGGGEGESMMLDFIEADNGEQVPTSAVLHQSLKYVFEFVMTQSQLSKTFPNLDAKEIQWVLTVPAIWTEKAKKKMREAASNAGMTPNGPSQLLIAKEPECASIMVETQIQDQETYILVDAGGGTIDIACHKKVQSGVIEVFPPTGGSWGSTYIDNAFGEMLIECFGEDVIEEFKVDEDCRSGWIEQMQLFAKAKENSKAGKNKNVTLANLFFDHLLSNFDNFDAFAEHLANFEYKGVGGLSAKKGRAILYISSEMWELLFSVVLDPICNHINHLLDEPSLQECSQIVLVGGFGGSDRLYRALVDLVAERDRLAGRDGASITIYQAHHPNLCVVNGAAQYPSVKDKFMRVAPRTYGVESLAKWTEEHPDDEWKVQFDGVWRYRKGFKKFVTIGEQLGENHTVVHKFRPAASSGVSVNIYCSTEENPKTTLRARQIGRTFVDFTDLPPERRSPEQILKILFHFGSSEIKAELQFEDGMVKPLDCDFTDVSFAAEIAQKYASS